MSSGGNNNQTSMDSSSEDFPVAAIVCLAVVLYVLLVIIILIIRYKLNSKGDCHSDCCGSEEGGCCVHMSNASPCYCCTSAQGFVSRLCGNRKCCSCPELDCCSCPELDCCSCSDVGGCCRQATFRCHPSCTGCCADCNECEDDFEPGTCGCLCLEIRFRSLKRGVGGSTRRSTSLPAYISEKRQYNTHIPREKSQEVNGGLDEDQQFPIENFNMKTCDTATLDGKLDAALKQHSTSKSPCTIRSRTKLSPLNTYRSVNDSQVRTPRIKSSQTYNSRVETLDSTLLSSTSTKRSDSISDDSSKQLNQSGRTLLSKNLTTSIDENTQIPKKHKSRISSQNRNSLRVAHSTSQRFPNKFLVSRDSLKLDINLNPSTGSKNMNTVTSHRTQGSSRSLPEPNRSVS